MVVVAIIGLLVGIAVPAYNKVRTESRIKKAESALQILSAGLLQLAWDTGKWPRGYDRATVRSLSNPLEASDLSVGSVGLMLNDGRFSNWKGPYVPKIPKDPWGKNYFFDPDYWYRGAWRVAVGSFGPNKSVMNNYDSDNIIVLLD
jgi:type II secretory pathway pseudopilin PulG